MDVIVCLVNSNVGAPQPSEITRLTSFCVSSIFSVLFSSERNSLSQPTLLITSSKTSSPQWCCVCNTSSSRSAHGILNSLDNASAIVVFHAQAIHMMKREEFILCIDY